MRYFLMLFLLIFVSCAPALAYGESGSDGKLIKAVVLSRHGVRAPTQELKILNLWSRKTWPTWPVGRGELTERGAGLVEEMWKNLHDHFVNLKLLAADVCLAPESVYVRADVDERTKATARAILNGLAKNCRLGFAVLQDEKVDPLFHPLKAGLYSFNPVLGASDVLAMTHGGLSELEERLSAKIALVGEIAGPPEESLCSRFTMTDNCTLADLPNAISVSPNGADIHLVGTLDIASSMAEIFLLEYAQWPNQQAGWGQVTEKILEQILPVHATVFDIVNRAQVVAWAKGSSLLREMTDILTGKHPDARCNKAKLVIYVGHDTNIANLGGLLKVKWQGLSYPENGIPPASALVLELWERNGSKEVVAKFFTQPIKALHTMLKEAEKDLALFAPSEAPVKFEKDAGEARLPLATFIDIVTKATKDAPIAPILSPPLDYAKIIPAENRQAQ